MARRKRYQRPGFAEKLAGALATFDGTCPRCDQPIINQQSQVVLHHHAWIHVQCAPGWED